MFVAVDWRPEPWVPFGQVGPREGHGAWPFKGMVDHSRTNYITRCLQELIHEAS